MRLRDLLPRPPGLFTAVVDGDSMLPGLRAGDWVLVAETCRIRVGQVVAARDPRDPRRLLVKRVRRPMAAGWWLEGDNPAASTDSRTFGAVPTELILGRVLLRYYPLFRRG